MFSSFTSLVPAGFSFGGLNKEERERERLEKERVSEDKTPRPPNADQLEGTAGTTGSEGKSTADELGVKKRRERNPNETFIVVRPPPSVSNHPLNLQIQLVPPSQKDRTASGSSGVSGASRRRSVDYSSQNPDSATSQDLGAPLTRSPSTRSGRSDVSSFYASASSASTTSMSSLASSSSVGSSVGGRRMIVPLYNLSAHNVMTNTVLDAGTDAKVAKFHKRGLEILGLVVLECVEVWPSYGRGGPHVTFATGKENAYAPLHQTVSKDGSSAPQTPTSSALSLSSVGSHPPTQSPNPVSPMTPTAHAYTGRVHINLTPTPTQSGAKKIFGKIFKKKDAQGLAAPGSPLSLGHTRVSSLTAIGGLTPESAMGDEAGPSRARRSMNASVPSPTPSHVSSASQGAPLQPALVHTPTLTSSASQPILQPPTLDIQPTLAAPVSPPAGRPTRYVWIVKRWLKGGEGGLLGGVMRGVGLVGANIGMTGLMSGDKSMSDRIGMAAGVGVEVRFEWVRGTSKNAKRRSRSAAHGRGSQTSLTNSATRRSRASAPSGTPSGVPPRRSVESTRSRERLGDRGRVRGRAREESMSRTNSIVSQSDDHGQPDDAKPKMNTSPKSSYSGATHESEEPANISVQSPGEDDEGEESDPEDSETPWTCSIVVSSVPSVPGALWEHEYLPTSGAATSSSGEHLHPITSNVSQPHSRARTTSTGARSDSHDGPRPLSSAAVDVPGTLLRLKVGTLMPAPHHPKVVAQLKVPFPLPDVDVAWGRIRRRVITPAGVARPQNPEGSGDAAGMFLTAEEIKDVLCCTAFWVVVKEGFGGVGKVSRKGDGWRIRA